jgi:hypothetical protein
MTKNVGFVLLDSAQEKEKIGTIECQEVLNTELKLFVEMIKNPNLHKNIPERVKDIMNIKNDSLIISVTKECINTRDPLILNPFMREIFFYFHLSIFSEIEKTIIQSDEPNSIYCYISSYINHFSDINQNGYNHHDNVKMIDLFLKQILKLMHGFSTQAKSAAMGAIIESCNPRVAEEVVRYTKNIECAKESVARYLALQLKSVSTFTTQNLEYLLPDISKIFLAAIPDTDQNALSKFTRKSIRKSVNILDIQMNTKERMGYIIDKIIKAIPFLNNEEDARLEKILCSDAISEIVLLLSTENSKLTPSQIIGDSTRKRAARVF